MLWRQLKHPEFGVRMMHDGDELAFGGSNFEIATLEVDGVVVIDASRGAQRKVEIQERGRRAWTH